MAKKNKVSVIVPVYKVEKFLDRCVESIVNQTYTNLEIVLVDDGSPDNCPEMCDEWAKKDERIKVIHKTNGGLSDARNAGIKIITGEYVWFVDSDDYIEKNAIEELLENAVAYKSDVVLFDAYRDTCGKITKLAFSFDELYSNNNEVGKNILQLYYTNNHNGVYSVWNKFYKVSFIKENSLFFDPDDVRCEDCWFNFKVFHIANVVSHVSQNFYYYFDNKESITHNINNISYGRWVRNKKRLLEDDYFKSIEINFDSFYYEFIYNVIIYLKNLQKLGNYKLFDQIIKDEFLSDACKYNSLLPFHIRFIAILIQNNKIDLVKFIYKMWNMR